MSRDQFFKAFLLALLLFVLYQIGKILSPFFGALLSAVVIAVACYPLYEKFGRWIPSKNNFWKALLFDFLVFFFLIGPVIFVVWMSIEESGALLPLIKKTGEWLKHYQEGGVSSLPWSRQIGGWLRPFGVGAAQVQDQLMSFAEGSLSGVSAFGASVAKNILGFLVQLAVMLFVLFFLFKDGRAMQKYLETYLPLHPRHKTLLLNQMQVTIVSIIRGWFLTALVQGITATLGYVIVGLDLSLLLGFLTAVASLVPSVGTTLVWLPIGIILLLKGSIFKGVFICCWGGLVVGVLDNVIRPYFVGTNANLPILWLFLSLLGGVEVYGVKGIFLGPLLVAVAPILLEIFRQMLQKPRHVAASD